MDKCMNCSKPISPSKIVPFCNSCIAKDAGFNMYGKQLGISPDTEPSLYNQPAHYHQHDIDTIEFLKRGFPPEVCANFFIGNIIKYTQRAQYKNGREDLLKVVDYAQRLLDWHDECNKQKDLGNNP